MAAPQEFFCRQSVRYRGFQEFCRRDEYLYEEPTVLNRNFSLLLKFETGGGRDHVHKMSNLRFRGNADCFSAGVGGGLGGFRRVAVCLFSTVLGSVRGFGPEGRRVPMLPLPRENRHGLINGLLLPLTPLVSLAAMLVYTLWSFWFPAAEGHFHLQCACRHLTGLPCPCCGFTRSMTSLYGGNIEQAFLFQPFALVWLAFLLYLSVVFVLRIKDSPRLMRVGEMQFFFLLFITSWAAKLLIGVEYF